MPVQKLVLKQVQAYKETMLQQVAALRLLFVPKQVLVQKHKLMQHY